MSLGSIETLSRWNSVFLETRFPLLSTSFSFRLTLFGHKISMVTMEPWQMMTVGKAAIDGPVASPHGALVLKMICKVKKNKTECRL